jgi:hypothetical protein
MAVTGEFLADFSDFDKGVKGAEKNLANLQSSAGKTGDALGGAEAAASMFGLSLTKLATGFTIGAVAKFAMSIVETGAALDDLSERTGISVETLQQWGNVAEQSGGSAEALARSAFTLSKALAGDSTSVAGAVKALGLDLQALRAMSPEERFRAVTAALMAMQDPLKQAETGALLLGRGFDELKPSLNKLASDTSTLITYTKDQTAAMAALSNMATTTKNSIGPLTVSMLDWVLGVSRFTTAVKEFRDTMSGAVPPIAQADAKTREWNQAIDDRVAKPLTLTLQEEQQFIEESNEAVRRSVAAFKDAADMRAYYNMIGEREIDLIERTNAARAKSEADLRAYYNWVGERQMEDAQRTIEAEAAKLAAVEASNKAILDAALADDAERNARAAANAAAAATPGAVNPATSSIMSAGVAAQQAAGSFFAMSAQLYTAIRAAQQFDDLARRDPNIYGSTIGGIAGSSPTSRYIGAASAGVNVTINGSVLANKNDIARVVGDAVTSSYRTGGNRQPV